MARDGSGTYTRVSNSFSSPVSQTVISPTDAETFFDELDTEITDSLSRSGKGGMSATAVLKIADGTSAAPALSFNLDTDTGIARTTANTMVVAASGVAVITVTPSGLTLGTDLAVTEGGTGGSTATSARANLGLVIGTDVQSYSARLQDIATITYASGDILYYNGTNLVKLAKGSDGDFLRLDAGLPDWEAIPGGGDLLAANNLSDVSSTATSRYNLYAAPFDAMAFNGMQLNAAMEISQENEDTAVTLVSNVSGYICDGFVYRYRATATLAMECQRVAPPGSPSFQNAFKKAAQAKATTGLTPLATTDHFFYETIIEGYRTRRLNWGSSGAAPITVGFWVYATIAGTMTVSALNQASNRSYVVDVVINSATTWEYKTVTIPGDQAGTWEVSSSKGLKVRYCFGAGATFQTAASTWTAGEFHATASTTNFFATTNNIICMTGVTVHPGSDAPSAAASPFIMKPYDVELKDAQRFYWKTFEDGVKPVQNVASELGALIYRADHASTVGKGFWVPHPVKMSITPYTITFYNPRAANTNWRNISATADSGSSTASRIGQTGFLCDNGQAAGDSVGHICAVHCTVDAR